jgi:hypothetical protein
MQSTRLPRFTRPHRFHSVLSVSTSETHRGSYRCDPFPNGSAVGIVVDPHMRDTWIGLVGDALGWGYIYGRGGEMYAVAVTGDIIIAASGVERCCRNFLRE